MKKIISLIFILAMVFSFSALDLYATATKEQQRNFPNTAVYKSLKAVRIANDLADMFKSTEGLRKLYSGISFGFVDNKYDIFLSEFILAQDTFNGLDEYFNRELPLQIGNTITAMIDFLKFIPIDDKVLAAAIADKQRIEFIFSSAGSIGAEDAQLLKKCDIIFDKAIRDGSLVAFLKSTKRFADVLSTLNNLNTIVKGAVSFRDFMSVAMAYANTTQAFKKNLSEMGKKGTKGVNQSITRYTEQLEGFMQGDIFEIVKQALTGGIKTAFEIYKTKIIKSVGAFLVKTATSMGVKAVSIGAKAGSKGVATSAGVLYAGYEVGIALGNLLTGTDELTTRLALIEVAGEFEDAAYSVMITKEQDMLKSKASSTVSDFKAAFEAFRNIGLYSQYKYRTVLLLMQSKKVARSILSVMFKQDVDYDKAIKLVDDSISYHKTAIFPEDDPPPSRKTTIDEFTQQNSSLVDIGRYSYILSNLEDPISNTGGTQFFCSANITAPSYIYKVDNTKSVSKVVKKFPTTTASGNLINVEDELYFCETVYDKNYHFVSNTLVKLNTNTGSKTSIYSLKEYTRVYYVDGYFYWIEHDSADNKVQYLVKADKKCQNLSKAKIGDDVGYVWLQYDDGYFYFAEYGFDSSVTIKRFLIASPQKVERVKSFKVNYSVSEAELERYVDTLHTSTYAVVDFQIYKGVLYYTVLDSDSIKRLTYTSTLYSYDTKNQKTATITKLNNGRAFKVFKDKIYYLSQNASLYSMGRDLTAKTLIMNNCISYYISPGSSMFVSEIGEEGQVTVTVADYNGKRVY